MFYASNGGVQATSPFSADKEAAAKGVRLPFGNGGAYTSIYLSTMSLINGWPAPGPYTRREILLIADGIDRFRGDPFSPDVQLTYEKAEKAGIMIHTLYASGVGRAGRNTFRVNYGQSNLDQLTERTGGESFFQGLQTPISFAPFLEQLDMVLKNQYFLSFKMDPTKNGKPQLRSFKIRTEQKNVDISSADQVLVAAADRSKRGFRTDDLACCSPFRRLTCGSRSYAAASRTAAQLLSEFCTSKSLADLES